MKAQATQAPKNVAVDRALTILTVFVGTRTPMSLTEISNELGLDKSVVHRVLITLVQHNYLDQDSITKKFQVGVRLWELGQNFVIGARLDEVAVPMLAEFLSSYEGTTGYIGVLDDVWVTFLSIVNAFGPMKLHPNQAKRTPAFSNSVGRAILANIKAEKIQVILDDERFRRAVREKGWTIPQVQEEFEAIRAKGYAANSEESTKLGAVSVPIINTAGYAIASVGVTYPLVAPFMELSSILPDRLKKLAEDIGREI